MEKTKTKKRIVVSDFTGNSEEPLRSALGVNVGKNKVTKTDETDNERFNIQYKNSNILKNIRDKSR